MNAATRHTRWTYLSIALITFNLIGFLDLERGSPSRWGYPEWLASGAIVLFVGAAVRSTRRA